jgi:hypothetical protein
MVYDRHSCDLVLVGSANEAYRLNLEQVLPCLCNNEKPENLNDVISSLGGSFCLLVSTLVSPLVCKVFVC